MLNKIKAIGMGVQNFFFAKISIRPYMRAIIKYYKIRFTKEIWISFWDIFSCVKKNPIQMYEGKVFHCLFSWNFEEWTKNFSSH